MINQEFLDKTKPKARVIALYLPQFHPVPENDKFWGKGFTEWTNVARSKPLFRGHYQPRIPADLGFYDLRLSEVRKEQAKLARDAGIEGFCYWHYWFGNGKEVLEMPFNEVVKSGEPDFPFCLGWANHDWTTKTWDKGTRKTKDTYIFKQEYPGKSDYVAHFYRYINAFKDKRYIKVDGKLLFVIFSPQNIPDVSEFFETWNELSDKNDLPGFHYVALIESMPILNSSNIFCAEKTVDENINQLLEMGFDGVETTNQKFAELKTGGKLHKIFLATMRKLRAGTIIEKYDYKKIMENFYTPSDLRENVYPQLLVGWDRSPRSGKKAIIYYNSNPKTFEFAAKRAMEIVSKKNPEHRLIFLNSWNEWGEGAYMEPDLKYGRGYLDVLRKVLMS